MIGTPCGNMTVNAVASTADMRGVAARQPLAGRMGEMLRPSASAMSFDVNYCSEATFDFGKTPKYRNRNASEFLAGRTPIIDRGAL